MFGGAGVRGCTGFGETEPPHFSAFTERHANVEVSAFTFLHAFIKAAAQWRNKRRVDAESQLRQRPDGGSWTGPTSERELPLGARKNTPETTVNSWKLVLKFTGNENVNHKRAKM